MFNFTKPFERNRLVVHKRIRSQWSNSTIICICTIAYEDDIIIFLCLCSLSSILCCAFTYFPHLSTTPFTKPFAKCHYLECYFFYLNFFPRLIFLYLSANSYGNILTTNRAVCKCVLKIWRKSSLGFVIPLQHRVNLSTPRYCQSATFGPLAFLRLSFAFLRN